MRITVDLEFEPCMTKGADGSRSGHMHLQQVNAEVKTDGKKIGEIGADSALAIICRIGDESYHVRGLDIWRALYTELEAPSYV